MKIRVIAVLFLIGLVTGAHADDNQSITQPQPQYCHVIVQDNKAAFVFPIMEDEKWTWFNKETNDNELEYSWEVIIPDEKQHLKLGAFLFNYPGQKEKSGTLQQLINETQWSVFDQSPTPNGGTTSKMLEDMKIVLKVIDGGIVVGITDKATFDRAFTPHPRKAYFVMRTPFDAPFTCDALIDYRGK